MLELLPVIPAVFSLFCLLPMKKSVNLFFMLIGTLATACYCIYLAILVAVHGPIGGLHGTLFIDQLSAFHLLIIAVVFSTAALFAQSYFAHETDEAIPARSFSFFDSLWMLSMSAMVMALSSNNIIIIWASIEATTLFTCFLISLHKTKETFEAMWKYLLICGVGVSFALIGIVFVLGAGERAGQNFGDIVLWTNLVKKAAGFNAGLMKAGFIFIFIGFGTKAGLAPMHTWLPDAHSKAPAPVSAIFSGFMLSLAVYGIARFIPVLKTIDPNFTSTILIVFGTLSLVVGAISIAFQNDIKRLLAYSSIEHIGIITLAFGLGPVGAFAGLFHTMNHSLAKTFAFIGAGKTGQIFGTYEMKTIKNLFRSSIWGVPLFIALLTLIGMAPFAIFMSKLQVIRAMVLSSSWVLLAVFILATVFVFIEILRHLMSMTGKGENEQSEKKAMPRPVFMELLIIIALIAALSVVGLWLPHNVKGLLITGASIISGTM